MTGQESGWVRNQLPGQPGWFIAGHYADPGWLITDDDIARLPREQVEGMITGLPPLPEQAWQAADDLHCPLRCEPHNDYLTWCDPCGSLPRITAWAASLT